MFCRNCQYDLFGLVQCRCPECGRAFNPNDDRTYLPTPHTDSRAWIWFVVSFAAAPFAGAACRMFLTSSFLTSNFGFF